MHMNFSDKATSDTAGVMKGAGLLYVTFGLQ